MSRVIHIFHPGNVPYILGYISLIMTSPFIGNHGTKIKYLFN